MHAIYFLYPCYDSIEKLQNDFSNKKNPMYGNIHILLTNALSDKLMEIIAKNDNLVSRIKTFTETCHDFASP